MGLLVQGRGEGSAARHDAAGQEELLGRLRAIATGSHVAVIKA